MSRPPSAPRDALPPGAGRRAPEPLFAAVHIPRFTAQALAAARPELRGQPFFVVEQDAESHRTLVAEVSPAAEPLRNVRPGLPAFLARRKHPRVPVVRRDPAAEEALRARMRALWERCTPAFAVRAGGGALLDMTGTPAARRHPPEAWAARLQAALFGLGLEAAAVAVAPSRAAARMLARGCAPRGVRVCPADGVIAALDPLPSSLLPGLSPRALQLLAKYGLDTVAKVRGLDREALRPRFGTEAEKIHALARGLDLEATERKRAPPSAETVLPRDVNDEDVLRRRVRLAADKLGHVLRTGGLRAARLTLELTYSDGRTARRTARLHPPTAAFDPLAGRAASLFLDLYARRVALRRIRLLASAAAAETGQIDLFDTEEAHRRAALDEAVDRIRRKRGFGKVLCGGNVGAPDRSRAPRRNNSRRAPAGAPPPDPRAASGPPEPPPSHAADASRWPGAGDFPIPVRGRMSGR